MTNPNASIFDGINDLAGKSSVLDSLGKFGAQDLIFVIVAIAAVLCLWLLLRDIRFAFEVGFMIVIAAGVALLIGRGISSLWYEARPFVDHPDTVKLISHSADAAFPSDHCLVAGAVAAVALLSSRWLGLLAAVVAVLIALSRVFVGVHYPGDVLAGLAIGAACGVIAWVAVRTISPHLPIPGRRIGLLDLR